ncbi:hypothetical protein F0L74_14720 [Chitinophaga agrisoli]|uniref:MORN repeat protein n=1 Tax=Chitinophaga agrisoli TaxID=2607653 RepID=A0A5B2W083_9BACT|nr:hypothetical protein [Chitinophaga agrisoli]KAA2243729.1 hypothetical protein F0L74_14720 [Chitinophaga agrisoli]
MKQGIHNIGFSVLFILGVLLTGTASCQQTQSKLQQAPETGYTLLKTKKGKEGLVSELWTYGNDTSKYLIRKYRYNKLITISHYEQGKANGYIMMANDSGVILLEGAMKDGKRHGIFKNYDDTGKLLSTMTYENDSLIENK